MNALTPEEMERDCCRILMALQQPMRLDALNSVIEMPGLNRKLQLLVKQGRVERLAKDKWANVYQAKTAIQPAPSRIVYGIDTIRVASVRQNQRVHVSGSVLSTGAIL